MNSSGCAARFSRSAGCGTHGCDPGAAGLAAEASGAERGRRECRPAPEPREMWPPGGTRALPALAGRPRVEDLMPEMSGPTAPGPFATSAA